MRCLPAGRHSAVYYEEEDNFGTKAKVGIHWAKRKNRQGGAMLWRECECESRGTKALCAVHRFGERLKSLPLSPAGTKVFPQLPTGTCAKNLLRRYLRLLQIRGASTATMKCIRAGKATALAMAGSNIQDILKLGGWKGAGALSYIDVARVDQAHQLRQSVEGSSEEEN